MQLQIADVASLQATITSINSAISTAQSNSQPVDATLTAFAGLSWTAGKQVPVFTAADTISFLTVGQAAGNLLDKAAGDALYAALSHTHTIAQVTGLQSALDAKLDDSQATAFGLSLLDDADAAAARTTLGLGTAATAASGAFAAATHTHAIADITGLQTALDGKAASTHTHAYTDIVSVPTASLIGRTTAATGAAEVLTATQVTAMLNEATTSLKGLLSAADKTKLDGIASGASGTGTVTSVSVVTANGVSGTVANASTTPAITLSLGAITPTSVASTGQITGTGMRVEAAAPNFFLKDTGAASPNNRSGIIWWDSASANTASIGKLLSNSNFYIRNAVGDILMQPSDATMATFSSTGLAVTGTVSATGNISGANFSGTHSGTSSGTNTGDQTISLTGDVTGSGTGSFATTIGANKVTLGMLAQVATASFLGRTTASTGNVEALTATQATALLDAATTSLKGLMSAADKTKLDGVASGATANSGTVTGVSVVTANGISGTVATASTTPAITLSLGAITPSSVAISSSGATLNVTDSGGGTATPMMTLSRVTPTTATEMIKLDVTGNASAARGPYISFYRPNGVGVSSLAGKVIGNLGGMQIFGPGDTAIATFADAGVSVTGTLSATGNLSAANFSGTHSGTSSGTNTGDQTTITGNAGSATVLQTARTIAISGAVTGTATSFNGSANITIPITALDVGSATAGTLAVARGGTGVTTSTGSGNNVLSASPTFTGTATFAALAATATAAWSASQQGPNNNGAVHLGSSAANGSGPALTFGGFSGATTGTAQAGIYTTGNSVSGTSMYLSTTNNYTTGPQTAISISPLGAISIPRGDVTIQKDTPWLTLHSNALGTVAQQAAGISIGESGYQGTAALHLTYRGDGYAYIGMGGVASDGTPVYPAIQTYYGSSNVWLCPTGGTAFVGSSAILHAGNYTSYSPSLTGSGASGTWGIGITGSAASLGGVAASGYVRTDGSSVSLGFLGNWQANSGAVGASDKWGYQQAGSWTAPYPDLILGYHTGIKIGAHTAYGGTRFYNDHPNTSGSADNGTEIFSVGNGDNHVRVVNNLYVGGNLAIHAGNYTSYAPSAHIAANYLTADTVAQNAMGYAFLSSGTLFGQTDGALYSGFHSSTWKHQIWGDLRTGQLAVRGMNAGSWTAWRAVLDDTNFSNYALKRATGSWITSSDSVNRIQFAASSHTYLYIPASSNIYFQNSSGSNVFTFTHSGAFTAADDITAFSDASLKENVETIRDALSKVCGMRGVTFTRKDTGRRSSGVIAQEFETQAPELVHENEGGIKSVSYGQAVGYTIEAIKELKEIVDEQRAMIEELRAEIAELRNKE